MKIKAEKKELVNAVKTAALASAGATTINNYASLMFEAEDGRLIIHGFSTQAGIRAEIACETEETGMAVVNTIAISAFMNKLPSKAGEVVLFTDSQASMMSIRAGRMKAAVPILGEENVKSYNRLKKMEPEESDHETDGDSISELLGVSYASDPSADGVNVAKACMEFFLENGVNGTYCTDGKAVALRTSPADNGEEFSAMVPVPVINRIRGIFPKLETVWIRNGKNKLYFLSEGIVIQIPKSSAKSSRKMMLKTLSSSAEFITVKLDRTEFMEVLDRAQISASSSQGDLPVRLNLGADGGLTFTVQKGKQLFFEEQPETDPEVCRYVMDRSSGRPAKKEMESCVFGYSTKYMSDTLKHVDPDEIMAQMLSLNEKAKGVFTIRYADEDGRKSMAVILPVQVKG